MRLERIQNEAIIIILGCPKDTPAVAMRFLLDLPTISHRIETWRVRSFLKINANKDHPLHEELSKEKGCRLKRGRSWLSQAESTLRNICEPSGIEPGEEWIAVPPQFQTAFTVITSIKKNCEQTPSPVNAEVESLLNDNANETDAVVYTDGSVIRQQRCAWAFSARSGGKIIGEVSGAYATTTSSLTMEVRAVTEAVTWLASHDFARVFILSDSMSMIRKVESGMVRRNWVEALVQTGIKEITFIFVPGHAGVSGNERADRLAGMATVSEGAAMDRNDILNALRESFRTEEFQDCESHSLTRLREMGVKIGAARKERHTKYAKRLINQHRTGVLGRWTLLDLLRRRSEHLWTCPACYDDSPHITDN